MISNFLFNFINFCVIVSFFLPELLTPGIMFPTAVTALVVGISPLSSFILALREAL